MSSNHCNYRSGSLGAEFFHYYNKNSLNSVIAALMTSSSALYNDIINAINNYWGISTYSTSSVDVGCGNKESNCDISMVHSSVSHFKDDNITIHKSYHKDNFAPQGCMASTPTNSNSLNKDNKSGLCNHIICSTSNIENPQSSKTQIGDADSSITSNVYAMERELPSETRDELKKWIIQMQCGPSSYINFYYFGHVSSSITAEITSELLEDSDDDDEIISTQQNIISKNIFSFDFSVFQKSSLDAHKEGCGWCFYCRSRNCQECLLYVIERKYIESPEYLSVGFSTNDNEKSHMDLVVHNCLVIEERLHGLISGPWEDPDYTKEWRKSILETTDIESIKNLLLTVSIHLLFDSSLFIVYCVTHWHLFFYS